MLKTFEEFKINESRHNVLNNFDKPPITQDEVIEIAIDIAPEQAETIFKVADLISKNNWGIKILIDQLGENLDRTSHKAIMNEVNNIIDIKVNRSIVIRYYEGSYKFDEEIFPSLKLDDAKQAARERLERQFKYRRTKETLWATFSPRNEGEIFDERVKINESVNESAVDAQYFINVMSDLGSNEFNSKEEENFWEDMIDYIYQLHPDGDITKTDLHRIAKDRKLDIQYDIDISITIDYFWDSMI